MSVGALPKKIPGSIPMAGNKQRSCRVVCKGVGAQGGNASVRREVQHEQRNGARTILILPKAHVDLWPPNVATKIHTNLAPIKLAVWPDLQPLP